MLPLSKGCCLFPSFVVWSVLCGCGFLTSLFGLLSGPAGWLCLIYDSLKLMVQNQDLCLWCCDWTSAGSLASSLLSVALSHLLPLDVVSDGRWVSRLLISIPTLYLICLCPPFLSARGVRLQADRGSSSPSDKATRPCLTFLFLFLPQNPSALLFTHWSLISSA